MQTNLAVKLSVGRNTVDLFDFDSVVPLLVSLGADADAFQMTISNRIRERKKEFVPVFIWL